MQAQQTRDDLPVRLIDAETERVVLSCILGRGLEVWMLAGPQLADFSEYALPLMHLPAAVLAHV